jgi:hypothetical protein
MRHAQFALKQRFKPVPVESAPRERSVQPEQDERADHRSRDRDIVADVDHGALLRALFPDGIPPRQDVIAAVNDWLSQADRLAGQL